MSSHCSENPARPVKGGAARRPSRASWAAAVLAGIGFTIGASAFASASARGVDDDTIQYGQAGVCDTDGVNIRWQLDTDHNVVRSVRVTDIAPECVGAKVLVQVDGDTVRAAGVTGPSVKFPLGNAGTYPTPQVLAGVQVWFEG